MPKYFIKTDKGSDEQRALFVFDGGSIPANAAYKRNSLTTQAFFESAIPVPPSLPNVTIVSVTEPAVETEPVTVVATTTAGTLSYKFELEFNLDNWLTIQDGPSNIWTPAVGTTGFRWRVTVEASDGKTSDSETFTPADRIQTPSSETILDVFTCTSQKWRDGNVWWNTMQRGTWSSTGTTAGDYFTIDSGSYLKTDWIRTGGAGATSLNAGSKLRITFAGQTTALPLATYGQPFNGGDLRFDWDGGAVDYDDLKLNGNFGLTEGVTLTIEVIAP